MIHPSHLECPGAIHAYGLLHEQSVSICDNILTCVTILLFQGDQAIDRIIQKQDLLVCQITGQEDLKTSFVTQVMDVANSFWLQNERSVSSLQATVDFLLKTCCVDVTLQFVADYVRLNASYLSVVFKKKTGINFKDYVTAYKMKSASQQLINLTTTRIYEISQGLGYADAMHFSRVFRKYYGMTQNEYRSSHMSGCKKIYRS